MKSFNRTRFRRIGLTLLWLSFMIYAFGFAPPNRPGTLELIQNLATGQWAGINPLAIALFNLMGVWPLIYASVLFIDGRNQKIWAWPFAIASFGVGAFALLPYLILRAPNPDFTGEKNWLLQLLDSRWNGIILAIATLILVGGGFFYGDWADFVNQWQTSRFIQVMSLDFCLLCLLFPALLGDDLARRDLNQSALFRSLGWLPLLGPAIYLCLRRPLPERKSELSVASR